MHLSITDPRRYIGVLAILVLVVAGCGTGATPRPSVAPTSPAGSPTDPAMTASTPASPSEPAESPSEPAESPSEPAESPSEPAESPSASVGGGVPVDLTGASFTVGSKEFTEQLILGQITIQALEGAGATVDDQTGLVGSTVVREALTGGDIDMYWEYTGTGWITHLGNTTPVVGTEEQFIAVRDADAENGIVWLEPAPLNNTYAIAVASETAGTMNLTTLSDLAENAEGATLCAASEFLGRDDGLPGLEAAYGFEFSDVATVELGLIPDQIASGEQCVFGEVFATDSRIAALDLLVLEDDLAFFPVYEPSLNVTQEVFDANPEIADLFAPIAAELDTVTMQGLNSRVDQGGENEADVAAAFLSEMGFGE